MAKPKLTTILMLVTVLVHPLSRSGFAGVPNWRFGQRLARFCDAMHTCAITTRRGSQVAVVALRGAQAPRRGANKNKSEGIATAKLTGEAGPTLRAVVLHRE